MTDRPWYRTEDLLPQLNAKVEVLWYGRQFKAMRTLWGCTKAVVWAKTRADGTLQRLPPERWAESWGDHPQFYRPVDPESWDWPLPEPLSNAVKERMWSSRGSGRRYAGMLAQAAQSEATVAQVKSEIDRELGPDDADLPFSKVAGGLWWRDANAVIYAPKGNVSVAMAEARILRFVAFVGAGRCLAGPDRWSSPLGRNMSDDAMAHIAEFVDHENEQIAQNRFPRLVQTEVDRRDEDEAGRWFLALNPPELWHDGREAWSLNREQRLLVWRSLGPPLSWRRIAKELCTSDFKSRNDYGAVLVKITRAANGQRVHQHVAVKDRMAALRERNRKAKLRDVA